MDELELDIHVNQIYEMYFDMMQIHRVLEHDHEVLHQIHWIQYLVVNIGIAISKCKYKQNYIYVRIVI